MHQDSQDRGFVAFHTRTHQSNQPGPAEEEPEPL